MLYNAQFDMVTVDSFQSGFDKCLDLQIFQSNEDKGLMVLVYQGE